jgi:hypothetical protein
MSGAFQKLAGLLGILAGVSGLLYFVFFVLLRNSSPSLSALSLLLLGLFGTATLVGLYQRLREVDDGFALWGLLLGLGGTLGATLHGSYDLANAINAPAAALQGPFPADPRGFLTFAVAGLAVFVLSWLMLRGGVFTPFVAYLGLLSGVLLIVLYIAYMVILNATNPLVLVLILATGILNPVWYLWIGWLLWQAPAIAPSAAPRRT